MGRFITIRQSKQSIIKLGHMMYRVRNQNNEIVDILFDHGNGMYDVEFNDGVIVCYFWELEFGV